MHCWLTFKLLYPRTPMSFSAKPFSSWVALSTFWLVPWVIHSQGQDYSLLGFHEVPVRLFLQTVLVTLSGSMTHWYVHNSTQLCIICKHAEAVLCPVIQIISVTMWCICRIDKKLTYESILLRYITKWYLVLSEGISSLECWKFFSFPKCYHHIISNQLWFGFASRIRMGYTVYINKIPSLFF